MSKSLHPPKDQLVAYGQGRLSAAEAETVEGHLAGCTDCLSSIENAPDDAIVTLVRSALPSAPPVSAATRTEYRNLTHFARGGLGEVLIARDTVAGREVAVKRLLSLPGDRPERRRRFLREAAITARLEHPGVAPVYGIGEDETGQPCYAMRFVPGKTLADAIRDLHAAGPVTAAGLRPLLSRFVALCSSVAYAHSRGVVHRDIKPANVAVGSFGETILLDWGLAQTDDAVDEPGDERPAEPAAAYDHFQTATGTVLGTPGFMAPEQAAGQRVAPSADVYSLGVTLRTMLTGRSPEVMASPFRSLMAIANRATASDPTARYAGALELAADVERWLADEPVSAYRDPFAIRALRFVRRHQTASATAVVLLVATTVSLGAGAALLAREQQKTAKARDSESNERAKAESKEAETASILGYVDKHVFAAGRPKGRDGGLGKDVKLAEAVTLAATSVDRSFPGQPLTEGRVRSMLGMTLLHLSDAKAAERQFALSRKLFEEQLGADAPDTLRAMLNLATSYRDQGRYKEALTLDEAVADRRTGSLGLDHPDTLKSLHNLANSYAALGREDDALRLDQEVYSRRLATLGPDDPDTIGSMASLASSHSALRQDEAALKLRQHVLKWHEDKHGRDDAGTLVAMNNLANTYGNLGRHDDALKIREQVVVLMRANSGPSHADTLMAMNNLARSFAALKRWPEALRQHREVLDLRRVKLAPDHPETLISMYNVAGTLLEMKRLDEALAEYDALLRLAQGKSVNVRLVPATLERRIRIHAARNDPAACRANAEQWDKLTSNSAEWLTHAAQLWAQTSAVQARATGPDAARLARADAEKAMAWLTKAVAAGFKDTKELEKDEFAALRDREDFKKLIVQMKISASSK